MRKYLLITLSFFIMILSVKAGDIDPATLPAYIGATNSGTEFYLTFLPEKLEANDKRLQKIFVSSMYSTKVTLEIPGLGIKRTQTTIPNSIITFDLIKPEGSPYTKTNKVKPFPEQIWEGRAIVITADDPVICYVKCSETTSSEGYLALPVSVLGTQYQVSSNEDRSDNSKVWNPSYTSIIGVFDNTKVTFTMGGCESCYALKENGEYLRFNQFIKRTLNKADIWLIPGIGPFNDLTGSAIFANKPVAVVSGAFDTQIPARPQEQDSAYIIEQEIPTYCWGKRYAVAPVIGRKDYSIIKIFAQKAETDVSINGVQKYTVHNPGGISGNGFTNYRADDIATAGPIIKPVLVSSNDPIRVVHYNPSDNDDSIDSAPFQMQISSFEQFRKDMTFYFPVISDSSTSLNNYINLVYRATSDNKIPDDILLGITVDGEFQWIKLKEMSPDSGQKIINTESGGRSYFSKTLNLSGNKVYRIKADDPFGVNIYGYDGTKTFGMLAGGRFKDLTVHDTKVPKVNFTIDDSGTVVGTVNDIIQNDVDSSSGLSVVTMIHGLSENYRFVRDEFVPGADKTVKFKFELIVPQASGKAVFAVSDRCGNDTVLVFNIEKLTIPALSGNIKDFGILKSSEEKELNFVFENKSDSKSETLKSVILEKNDDQFKIVDNITENTILNKGEKHNFKIKFTAKAMNSGDINDIEGIFKNAIGIELMNGEKIYLDTLTAEVSNPRLEIEDKNFNPINLSEISIEDSVMIHNTGITNLLVTGFEFDADSPFEFTLPSATVNNPLIMKSNGKYFIKIKFQPKKAGEFSTDLKVISDGYVIKDVSKISAVALAGNSVKNYNENSDLNIKYENGSLLISSVKNINLSSIKLFDLNGKILIDNPIDFSGNNYTLKLPELLSGIYLVKICTGGEWLDYKIAVIK